MTRNELIKELRTSKLLSVWTHWTPDDGVYVQAVKSEFIRQLRLYFQADELVPNVVVDDHDIWIN